MRFLRIRCFLAPGTRILFNRRSTVPLGDFRFRCGDSCGRKIGGVRSHVSDVALLVKALGHRHDLLG